MANTQPTDTLSGIINAINFPWGNTLSTGGTTPQPAPTSTGDLDAQLQNFQNQLLASAGTSNNWDQYFNAGTSQAQMEEIKQRVLPEEEMPEPPKLSEEFQRLRGEYGLDQLEQDLAELKNMEREQQAIRRQRLTGTYEERTRMSAIQGQVSEVERQEAERIDTINREIAYRADLVNSAYKIIDVSMNYLQMDWQNAKEWWTDKFNANLSLYKQLRSEFETDRTFEQQQREWEQSTAMANLQIYIDMVSNGQLFYENLSEAERTEITKLEVKSGLGAGFLSKIQIDPEKRVKTITTRDIGGVRYADILTVDPETGKLDVETIKIGKVSTGGSGGGGRGGSSTKTEPEVPDEIRAGATADLNAKVGADGKVSPTTWRRVRNQWLALGYSSELFNQYFGHYVNTSHAQDYEGYTSGTTTTSPKGGSSTWSGGYPVA